MDDDIWGQDDLALGLIDQTAAMPAGIESRGHRPRDAASQHILESELDEEVRAPGDIE